MSTSFNSITTPNKMIMYNISPFLVKVKIAYNENSDNNIVCILILIHQLNSYQQYIYWLS